MLMRSMYAALYGTFVAVWFVLILNALSQPAYAAYVDPGTGLFAFQMISSTLAGMGFLLRRRIRQFLARFSRNS